MTSEDEEVRRRGRTRTVEMAALVLLGGGLALLALMLPPGVQETASSGLFWVGLAVCAVVLLRETRRNRARSAAPRGGGPSGAPATSLQHAPWIARTYGFFLGMVLAQPFLFGDSLVARGAPVVLGAAALVGLDPLVRGSQRRQLAAARAEHRDQAVALVALVDLATMRLAQWAKAARATLPAEVGRTGVLAADAHGLALHRAGRLARLVHRWSWDEVELSCAPHPEDRDAAALVLTLLGPLPAPRRRETPVGRRRFDVTLSVRDGAEQASPAVVERAITDITAPRPTASSGSSVAGLGDVR